MPLSSKILLIACLAVATFFGGWVAHASFVKPELIGEKTTTTVTPRIAQVTPPATEAQDLIGEKVPGRNAAKFNVRIKRQDGQEDTLIQVVDCDALKIQSLYWGYAPFSLMAFDTSRTIERTIALPPEPFTLSLAADYVIKTDDFGVFRRDYEVSMQAEYRIYSVAAHVTPTYSPLDGFSLRAGLRVFVF